MAQKDDWKKFSLVIGIIIIALIVVLSLALIGSYSFVLAEKSVVFYSNDLPIEFGLEQIAKQKNFLVAVEINESGVLNQYMANSQNLFSVVLIGNKKNAVNLLKVVSPDTGELSYCRTNLGDVQKDEELSVEECNAMINEFDGVTIQVFFPDSSIGMAQVIVSDNIELHPSDADNIGIATFSILTKMFSNATDVVTSVNQIVGEI